MTQDTALLFYVNGAAVFPPNVKIIDESAFDTFEKDLFYVYGIGVEEIKDNAFLLNRIRKVTLPNVTKVGIDVFYSCTELHTVLMPKCVQCDTGVFEYD